jgi:hypothetical protein
MDNKPTPPILLKCTKCGYEWYSSSKRKMITCSGCQLKFNREKGIKNAKGLLEQNEVKKTDKPEFTLKRDE